MRKPLSTALSLLLLSWFAAPAVSDVAVTVEGRKIVGTLQSLRDGTLKVLPKDDADSPRELALVDLDRVEFHSASGPESASLRLITSEGPEPGRTRSATIALRAGLHRFILVYWPELAGSRFVRLEYSSASMPRREVPPSALFHAVADAHAGDSEGFDMEGLRLPDRPGKVEPKIHCTPHRPGKGELSKVADFSEFNKAAKSPGVLRSLYRVFDPFGPDSKLVDSVKGPPQGGCIFSGFLKVDADGEYTFYLTSDHAAQLYIGQCPTDFGRPSDAAALQPWRVVLQGQASLAGSIQSWDREHLTVRTPIGPDAQAIELPVRSVRQAWSNREPRETLEINRAAEPVDLDSVYVAADGNVQRVSGLVAGIDGDSLLFQYRGQDRRISMSRVAGVVLGSGRDPACAAEPAGLYHVLTVAGGPALPGYWRSLDDGVLHFETLWGPLLRLPRDQVLSVRIENGRLVYLSRMEPIRVEETPYFDRMMHYRTDRSVDDGRIQLADGFHHRGVSVHSRTALDYGLDGGFQRFVSKLGFQQPEGRDGNVAVRVMADGDVIYENASYCGSDPVQTLDLDVAGVNVLTLEVDFGKGQDVADRVVWADARLMRAKVEP